DRFRWSKAFHESACRRVGLAPGLAGQRQIFLGHCSENFVAFDCLPDQSKHLESTEPVLHGVLSPLATVDIIVFQCRRQSVYRWSVLQMILMKGSCPRTPAYADAACRNRSAEITVFGTIAVEALVEAARLDKG